MCQIPVVARVGDTHLLVGKTRAPHQMLTQVSSVMNRPVVPLWLTMPRQDVGTTAWVEAIAHAFGTPTQLHTAQSGTVHLVPIDGIVPDYSMVAKVAAKAAREIVRRRVEDQRRQTAMSFERPAISDGRKGSVRDVGDSEATRAQTRIRRFGMIARIFPSHAIEDRAA